jgi:hypothetical protein
MESGGSVVLEITAYARLAGIALLIIAGIGLALFNWYQSAIYYHAGVGLFFLFVGFSRLESTYVRQMVGGFGALLVAIGHDDLGHVVVAAALPARPHRDHLPDRGRRGRQVLARPA